MSLRPDQLLRCSGFQLRIVPAWLVKPRIASRWFMFLRRWRATRLGRFLHTKMY